MSTAHSERDGPSGPDEPPTGPRHYWLDGLVVSADSAVVTDELLALTGCYTTARVERDEILFGERHIARLQRDARRHALPVPAATDIRSAVLGLARAEFGAQPGVVRLQSVLDANGRPHLIGIPRALGAEPDRWRAVTAPFPHPGPNGREGAKMLGIDAFARARDFATERGVDETLLFDAEGHLVEGSRCNFVVVPLDGGPRYPDPRCGAVAGVALEHARSTFSELEPAHLTRADIASASELVALNAVRGARPICEYDGSAVGSGAVGTWGARLDNALRAPAP